MLDDAICDDGNGGDGPFRPTALLHIYTQPARGAFAKIQHRRKVSREAVYLQGACFRRRAAGSVLLVASCCTNFTLPGGSLAACLRFLWLSPACTVCVTVKGTKSRVACGGILLGGGCHGGQPGMNQHTHTGMCVFVKRGRLQFWSS